MRARQEKHRRRKIRTKGTILVSVSALLLGLISTPAVSAEINEMTADNAAELVTPNAEETPVEDGNIPASELPAVETPQAEVVPETVPEPSVDPVPTPAEEPETPEQLSPPAAPVEAQELTPEPMAQAAEISPLSAFDARIGNIGSLVTQDTAPGTIMYSSSVSGYKLNEHRVFVALRSSTSQGKNLASQEIFPSRSGTISASHTFTGLAAGSYYGCITITSNRDSDKNEVCSTSFNIIKAAVPTLNEPSFSPNPTPAPPGQTTLNGTISNWNSPAGYYLTVDMQRQTSPGIQSNRPTIAADGTYSVDYEDLIPGIYQATVKLWARPGDLKGIKTARVTVEVAKPSIANAAFSSEVYYAGDTVEVSGKILNFDSSKHRLQVSMEGTNRTPTVAEDGSFTAEFSTVGHQNVPHSATILILPKVGNTVIASQSVSTEFLPLPTLSDLTWDPTTVYLDGPTIQYLGNPSFTVANSTPSRQTLKISATNSGGGIATISLLSFSNGRNEKDINFLPLPAAPGAKHTLTVTISDGDRILATVSAERLFKQKPSLSGVEFNPAQIYVGDETTLVGSVDEHFDATAMTAQVALDDGGFTDLAVEDDNSFSALYEDIAAGTHNATVQIVSKNGGQVLSSTSATLDVWEIPTLSVASYAPRTVYIAEGQTYDWDTYAKYSSADDKNHTIIRQVTKGDEEIFNIPVGFGPEAEYTEAWPELSVGEYEYKVLIQNGTRTLQEKTVSLSVLPMPTIEALSFDGKTVDWVGFDGNVPGKLTGQVDNLTGDFTAAVQITPPEGEPYPVEVTIGEDGLFSADLTDLQVGTYEAELKVCQEPAVNRRVPDCSIVRTASLEVRAVPTLESFTLTPDRTSLVPETDQAELTLTAHLDQDVSESPFTAVILSDEIGQAMFDQDYSTSYSVGEARTYSATVILVDSRTEAVEEIGSTTAEVVPAASSLAATWTNDSLIIGKAGDTATGNLTGSLTAFDPEFYQVRVQFGDQEPQIVAVEEGQFSAALTDLTEGDYQATVSLWNTQYEQQVGESLVLPLQVRDYHPEVTLSKTEIMQGEEFTITGQGWPEETEVGHLLHSKPVKLVDSVRTGSDGSYSLTATMPKNAEVGTHNVVVTSSTGHAVSVPVTVKAAPVTPGTDPTVPTAVKTTAKATSTKALASTGSVAEIALLGSLGLTLLGLASLGLRRRRFL